MPPDAKPKQCPKCQAWYWALMESGVCIYCEKGIR